MALVNFTLLRNFGRKSGDTQLVVSLIVRFRITYVLVQQKGPNPSPDLAIGAVSEDDCQKYTSSLRISLRVIVEAYQCAYIEPLELKRKREKRDDSRPASLLIPNQINRGKHGIQHQ